MKYVSTRGQAEAVDSLQALLNGLAPDGGLYVPAEALEPLPPQADYRHTMLSLLERFFPEMDAAARQAAVDSSLARFRSPDVVPLKEVAPGVHFLELFHGPTYAFKDVALTLLPHLLSYAAKARNAGRVCVLTATSGDTGSAAMEGFAGVPGTGVLTFYPQVGTSEIQRRQMVCCQGENVSACAIEGNFDDAQAAVKAAFADPALAARASAHGCLLSSANSINIGRLFPQICYYLECARRLATPFDVVVPTGNFGNLLAAYFARLLGAPIGRFTVASNANRVVCDFIQSGTYNARRDFHVTNSPSMDILVSSNVERLLWLLTGGNCEQVRTWEEQLKATGTFTLSPEALEALHRDFAAGWATPEETERAIAELWQRFGYLADPHTAIGWKVHQELPATGRPTVIAATASPWKFPITMLRALTGSAPADDFAAARALGELTGQAPELLALEAAPIRFAQVTAKAAVPDTIAATFGF